jgi:hypothetical protein
MTIHLTILRHMKMRRILVLSLLVALSSTSLLAWGEKGHYISNEAATLGLPNDMPTFFYKRFPELVWLGFDPDRQRGGGESLEAFNAPNHFLDMEYVEGLKLPPERYQFLDLMYSSNRLRQHGITNSEAGFLPWQIAEVAQALQVEFRLWRASQPGSSERQAIENDIIHLAGTLGHFVADGANPHHATTHYNGWAGPNPNGYPNDCGTHSRFERDFVSHAVETKDVVPKLAAEPVLRTDYFATAVEHLRASNALTERIYQLDKARAFDTLRPVSAEGFDFATSRLAAGASLLRDIWWSAWRNSEQQRRRD